MSSPIKMPKARTPQSPKVSREEFARWVVNKQIADQMPEHAPTMMLDLLISLRHTRQLYQEHADMLAQITIDPDTFEQYLSTEVIATLNNNTRNIIKDLIVSNALSLNKSLQKMLNVLDEAMSEVDEQSEDFMEKMDERIFSYGK